MSGVRKVNQIPRVEGHGRIELERRDGRIVGARLVLYEPVRLFEGLLRGRLGEELPEIVCRICSICSTVHKVASLRAVEGCLGIAVSRQTDLLRQLALQGGQLASHALHLSCLALPDYRGCSSLVDLQRTAPKELQRGLALKALGNRIQEEVGGRAIHPFNLLLGGIGSPPAADTLRRLADELQNLLPAARATIALATELPEALPPVPPLPGIGVSGGPSLADYHIVSTDGSRIAAGEVMDWLDERLPPEGNARVSDFTGAGPYLTGPLARMNLDPHLEPEAAMLRQHHRERLLGQPVTASHLARSIELLQAMARATAVIDELLQEEMRHEPAALPTRRGGSATVLIEAPRGLLLHHYGFDDAGRCMAARVITPTAINQGAMAASLTALVGIIGGADETEVRGLSERLVRCFDPYISCAVH